MPNTPLAAVRNLLMDSVVDTVEFEKMGGMTKEETLYWFREQVVPDIEQLLSQL